MKLFQISCYSDDDLKNKRRSISVYEVGEALSELDYTGIEDLYIESALNLKMLSTNQPLEFQFLGMNGFTLNGITRLVTDRATDENAYQRMNENLHFAYAIRLSLREIASFKILVKKRFYLTVFDDYYMYIAIPSDVNFRPESHSFQGLYFRDCTNLIETTDLFPELQSWMS